MEKIAAILERIGLPFAYDHFAEGENPNPPFICYLIPNSDNFSADGRVYYKINEIHIELYTDCKDLSAEQKVEAVLDEHGIFYALIVKLSATLSNRKLQKGFCIRDTCEV